MAPTTLTITLRNTTTSTKVYAHVTGIPVDSSKGAIFFLLADGKTPYYPSSPAADQSAVGKNIAIPLAAPNSANPTKIVIPQIAGGRISISINTPLTFHINRGPALVEPSITNPSDPNYNILWSFCEFTFNNGGLFANITYVDFVALPIAMSLTNASGVTTSVAGLPSNGLATVAAAMRAKPDSADWGKLIYPSTGTPLRVLSPNSLAAVDGSKFKGYWEPYINSVWSTYSSKNLIIDTQGSAGKYTGRVSNGIFVFTGPKGDKISFSKPSSQDVFSCSTGPFGGLGNSLGGNLAARLCAAFNRSTLISNANQPDGEVVSNYYYGTSAANANKGPTNQYSKVVHQVNVDHKGYAFPYDDVVPSQGAADQAGIVADGNPKSWVVTIGGAGAAAVVKKPASKVQAPVMAEKGVEVEGKKKGIVRRILAKLKR